MSRDTETAARTVPDYGPIEADGRSPWVRGQVDGRDVFWLADTRRHRVVVRVAAGTRVEDAGAVCDMDTEARPAFNPAQMHWIRNGNSARSIVDKAFQLYHDQVEVETQQTLTRAFGVWTYEFRPRLGDDQIEINRRSGDATEPVGTVEHASQTASAVRLDDRNAHPQAFLVQAHTLAQSCWQSAMKAHGAASGHKERS